MKAETDNTALPELFRQRFQQIVPAPHRDTCWQSLHTPKRVGFRVNRLLAHPQQVADKLTANGFQLQPIAGLDAAYSVSAAERDALVRSEQFNSAEIYVQNPSSMLAVLALDPQPDETVLDLAAAPGGKTILCAQQMLNRGTLSAVESVRGRFFRLHSNLQRHGVQCAKCYLADGRSIGRKTPGRFDRVLLDAPCSGESRFHIQDPQSWQYWSKKKIAEAARKQLGLIRSALECLKPGGRLVYCTCSFAPEENEQIISNLLKKIPDEVGIVDLKFSTETANTLASRSLPGLSEFSGTVFHADLVKSMRILPDELWDGFYICCLTRKS
jgi:16S rRNA (cytosine1407-C5)-methyltransferase